MDYTWTISRIGKRNVTNANGDVLTDAIVMVKWKKSGTDADGNVGTYLGTSTLDLTNTSTGDFVAFDSVTTDDLLSWVQSGISESLMQKIDDMIADQVGNVELNISDWNG
jgi:hypothetical protein